MRVVGGKTLAAAVGRLVVIDIQVVPRILYNDA